MRKEIVGIAGTVLVLSVSAVARSVVEVRNAIPHSIQKEAAMNSHAKGTFEVKIGQEAATDFETANALGRMTIDKQIHGDLEATSKGEMLSAFTEVKGSGAYVALERVTGKLNGRAGSFILQHAGSMTSASQQLLIAVVPDSGTGQLVGLTGKFHIKIEDKKHYYEFEYSLPTDN